MSDDTVRAAYDRLCSSWQSLGAPERLTRLNELGARFAYNSGKMENENVTAHDTHEIFRRKRVASFSGELKTLYEIDNQRIAWDWMTGLLRDSKPAEITPDLIREAHRLLTRMTYDDDLWERGERPGTYKKGDYGVGIDQVIGYAPDEVEDAVIGLCDEVNEVIAGGTNNWNALTVGAYTHAMIADIHPFADGNGRTARLVENLLRLQLDQPAVIVHEKDRPSYYGALDEFHLEGSLNGMRSFIMTECIITSMSEQPLRGDSTRETIPMNLRALRDETTLASESGVERSGLSRADGACKQLD